MKLDNDQQDVLTELINIGVGRAAHGLSELVGSRIDLTVPQVTVCDLTQSDSPFSADNELLDTYVSQDFRGTISGRAMLALPKTSGLRLAQLLGELETEPDDLDIDMCGILAEVGNIVINGVLGSLGNALDTSLSYSVPDLTVGASILQLLNKNMAEGELSDGIVLLADANFSVANSEIKGSLILVFEMDQIESLVNTVMSGV